MGLVGPDVSKEAVTSEPRQLEEVRVRVKQYLLDGAPPLRAQGLSSGLRPTIA